MSAYLAKVRLPLTIDERLEMTDGPLWRAGWMVVAHRQPVDIVAELVAEAAAS